MRRDCQTSWFFAGWAVAVVLAGGILTSFHQPFRLPDAEALSVVLAQSTGEDNTAEPKWKVTHLLSGSCGCSQRVMVNLMQGREMQGVSQQIVLVDGGEAYLPSTSKVLNELGQAGFKLRHIADNELQTRFGVHGVPMLIVTTPEGKLAYVGGYGSTRDQYEAILHKLQSGATVAALPVLGCAVGRRNRERVDPFRVKY